MLIVGSLAGCAATPVGSRITGLTPNVLQQGSAAQVTAQVENWTPGTQLALMPAGPYLSHRLTLAAPPQAMVTAGPRTFIATADQQLSVVDFPPQTNVARILWRLPLPAPAKQLHVAKQRLLAVLADDRLQWLNISQDAKPSVLATLAAQGKVLDVQLLNDAAYLLLEADAGKTQLQRWVLGSDKTPQRKRQWSLPLHATAFAVRDQHLWVVTPDGIGALDLQGEQAVLKDFQSTSGMASDVQLQGQRALVADGRGGLVVFNISEPDALRWRGSFNKRGAIRGFAADGDSALLALQNGGVLRLGLGNPELPSSGAAWQTASPVVFSTLQGDAAVLATAHGLQRVMMLGGGDGAISAEGVNLGGSRRGVIRGDILYVADWFSGLHLYDISNPRQLRHLSNYHTPGSSKGVALLGHYALVGDDDQGLQIIDIEDPRHPSWTAELSPKAMARLGLAYTMKLVGKTLYLADHRGGFHIIDLSDIYHPRRLGGSDTPGKAWDIDVKDGVAFVADDLGGLLMFDVSNPAKPEPFAQFNPGGQAEDVALQDGRAYVAFFDQGLYTLDVSDPRHAKVIGHTDIPGNARSIELGDGLLYVASWEAGVQVVDTRFSMKQGPAIPRIIGSFDTDGAAWGVKVKDGYAYVLDWWGGIKVVDVRQPSHPAYVGRYQGRGTLQQLRTKGAYLYAASGAGGLQVYDIKNPLNPIWAKGLDIDGESRSLWLEDDRAYVAAGDGGVAIFDTLYPFYTHQVGGVDTPGVARQVVAGNEYLYIADSRAGLLVEDVRDPQRPVEVARYDVQVRDMWLDEQTLWLVTDTGLSGWKVTGNGRLGQKVTVPGEVVAVRSRGNLLVAATRSGRVKLWQQTAKGLRALGDYNNSDGIAGLQLAGDALYVLGSHNGLNVVDISQPELPRLTTVYPATGHHAGLVIARGAAFFAGEAKPASVTLLPELTSIVKNNRELEIQIPAELPRGGYHLLAVEPTGRRRLLPNAFKLQFAAPGKKNTTLDAFRRLLKTPLKPPPDVQTELPAAP